jgi:hypothetical protein
MVERPHDISPESSQGDRVRLEPAKSVELLVLLGNFADARELALRLGEPTHPDEREKLGARYPEQRADAIEIDTRHRVISKESDRSRVEFFRRGERSRSSTA